LPLKVSSRPVMCCVGTHSITCRDGGGGGREVGGWGVVGW
jgi:hypothetical protein